MSAPPPDTKNSDDDLLELADLIEDEASISSGDASGELDEDGVDTSFEQELEDLFAEDLGLPDDDDDDAGGAGDGFDALLEDEVAAEPSELSPAADASDDDDDLLILDEISEVDDDDDEILLLDDIVPDAGDDEPDMDLDVPDTDEAGGDEGDMDLDGLDDLIDDLQEGPKPEGDDDALSLEDLGAEELDDALGGDALDADDLMADLDGLDDAGGDDDDDGLLLLDEVVEEEVDGVVEEMAAVPEPEPAPAAEAAPSEEPVPAPDADELEQFLMSGSDKGIEYERDPEVEKPAAPEPVAEPVAEPEDDLGDLADLTADLEGLEPAEPEPVAEPVAESGAEEDDLGDLDDLMADVDDIELAAPLDVPEEPEDAAPGDDLDALLGEVEETLPAEPETLPEPPAEPPAEDVDDVLDGLPAAHDMDVDALLAQDEGGAEALGLDEIDALDTEAEDLLGMPGAGPEVPVEGLDTLEDIRAQILVMDEAAGNSRDLLDDLESRVASLEAAGEDGGTAGESVEGLFEIGSPLMTRIKDEIMGEVMERVDAELAGKIEAGTEDLKEDILNRITAELEKLVPAAAARVIREEIAALSEDLE